MSTQRRRVLENAGISDGVYIEGLNGRAYTVDKWQGGSAANSVIVASGDVKFRVALTEPSSTMLLSSSPTDPLERYMAHISDETQAKADYNGLGNTANIIKVQPSTDYAAGYCDAYIFPDGKTKGYLPSLGQLNIAYQNKVAIDAALSACGGTVMTTSDFLNGYWSSTFWGVQNRFRYYWMFRWYSNYGPMYEIIPQSLYVRPFADLT